MKKTTISKLVSYQTSNSEENCLAVFEEVKNDFPYGIIRHLETSKDITGVTTHNYCIELMQDTESFNKFLQTVYTLACDTNNDVLLDLMVDSGFIDTDNYELKFK